MHAAIQRLDAPRLRVTLRPARCDLGLDAPHLPRKAPPVRRTLAFALLALASCAKPTELSISITAGLEKDAFTADPPVTRVDVRLTSLDGDVDVSISAEPGGTFDLGNIPIDAQVGVEVTGLDAAGNTVMRGRSLAGLPLDSIQGGLHIFAQRTGQWARPPNGFSQTHVGGVATTIGERYILLTGGTKAASDPATADPAQLDSYDLFSLGGATANALPRVPQSAASLGDAVLAIDADGATWIDFLESVTYDPTPPEGLAAFGDVAGGASIASSDDRIFIVGGTRRTEPSRAVLEVASDGSLKAYELETPRKGAAAAWIEGVGLVVAGGSADGPGVEVLAKAGTAFASRGFPPDPTEGAGGVTDGADGLALIGGTIAGAAAPTRLLKPSCVTGCTVTEVASATLPAAMVNVATYLIQGTRVIVVGDEAGAMGLTRAFLVDLVATVEEIPFKEPRRGAVSVPTPLATLAIVGGEHPDGTPALSFETFWTTK